MGRNFANGTGIQPLAELNLQTAVDGDFGLWERPAMAASIAFLRYVRDLAKARATTSPDRVFVSIVDSGGEVNRYATLAPGQSLVVGRHTKCDLQINHSNVALRQIAVHLAKSSTAMSPLLRVWDLHTGQEFFSEDGSKLQSLASDGPTFLSLGRYHIAIVPLGQLPEVMPVSTREAWASLPQRNFLSAMAEGSGTRMMPEAIGAFSNTTSITRMPSSIGLREIEDTPVATSDRIGTLVVQSEHGRFKFHLGQEHLERGILVGRYGRCLGSGFDRQVSRVHVLLASVGGQMVGIDTASTVGCRVAGERIKTIALKKDTRIRLSKHSYLTWRPVLFD